MNRSPVRFALLLVALLAALTLLARSSWVERELRDPLCVALANTVSYALVPFGIDTAVDGSTVRGATGAVEIVYDCDGIGLLIFFVAATLACPIPRRRDILPGIAWGALVIHSANVVRLTALTWLNLYDKRAFEFVHAYVFQGVLIVVTLAAWAAWVIWAQPAGAGRRLNAMLAYVVAMDPVALPIAGFWGKVILLAGLIAIMVITTRRARADS